ncbi:hypothetical protein [Hyphomicrobium sp. CS1GBMeth3]|uniref:hypothetical protein n=1 Tax=Hyphomicrobium sp. CS1GBMeth3 TaxID=1892845 RepID=UPI0009F9E40D|nr:hypothetical protein [Hyphomicrobium sp. CS1GBMeth3]
MQKVVRSTFLSLASGAMLLAGSLATPALADPDLAGSWRGGGTVKFSSGATEQARCRATFSPSGDRAYDVRASCATQSGTVSQTAFVRGRGSNYRGTFYNPEFDTSGKIQISVSGKSQVVRLTSTKGSAVIRLSRSK